MVSLKIIFGDQQIHGKHGFKKIFVLVNSPLELNWICGVGRYLMVTCGIIARPLGLLRPELGSCESTTS